MTQVEAAMTLASCKERDADASLDSAVPLLALTTGHAVIRSWCDGKDVCIIHEVSLRGATEPITMADQLTVRGGR